jgi:FAD/FMN-containing dehydrogenase
MTTPRPLTRRQAVALLGGAAVSVAVPACSSSSSAPTPVRRTPKTGSPSPTGPTAADWRALQRQLTGTVRQPGSPGYDRERLLFDRRFDQVKPAAVARVASEPDIGQCLDFARHTGLPVRVRSGGHSYVGASTGTGLVIDLRSLAGVEYHGGATAEIGPGAALVDVYSRLAAQGVSIPAGSCPTVGLSGLALGGGVGVVARRYGLTCDRLVSARVVTADGNVVTSDAHHRPDLYWALRGGGGSFGVVTSLQLRTHAADPLAHAYVVWPWSAASDVVAAWQAWAPGAPNALWSAAHVLATDGPAPMVAVVAVMVGSSNGLRDEIGKLVQAIPAAPTANSVASQSYAATMMLEAGCSQLSAQQCHIAAETPGGTLPRDAFVAASDFFRHPIPRSGIPALVKAIESRQTDPRLGAGGASFDILGGAIDDLGPAATAWSHRGALFNAQYTASWGKTPGNGPLARNQHSLAAIHHTVQRYATGEAYQNYADDSLANPLRAYYGENLARLTEVRRTYDPTGVFTTPQGIPLT